MEDFLRDAGLKYAQHLPGAIAGLFVALVLIGWAFWVVFEGKRVDLGDFRKTALVILSVLALVCLVQAFAAYGQAESYCRDLYKNSGSSFGRIDLSYSGSKCSTIWPAGP